MTRRLSMLLLLFFTLSCGKGSSEEEIAADPNTEDSLNAILADDPVPANAATFKVNITYVNFTPEQKAKYEKAVAVVKKVIASEEFKNRVLTHSYNGTTTYVDNRGKTNSAIYLNLLNGNETLQNTRNNAMDVEVELYYQDTTTVGYTYANSRRIWVNTKYFDSYTPSSVAGNLFHEWAHKLGYTHDASYSESRDYSVPYGLGKIMRTLGAKVEGSL